MLNVVLSVVVGFAAVFGGIYAARMIEHVPVTSHALYDEFERAAGQVRDTIPRRHITPGVGSVVPDSRSTEYYLAPGLQ